MALTVTPRGDPQASTFITLTDTTLAEVAQTAAAMGEMAEGGGGLGHAYDTNAAGQVTAIRLTMRLFVRMPVWSHASDRPAAERREWRRVLRALRVHEDGHVRISRSEAPAMHTALKAKLPCSEADFLTEFQAQVDRVQALHDAYDVRTGHGTTQATPHGTTVFNVP